MKWLSRSSQSQHWPWCGTLTPVSPRWSSWTWQTGALMTTPKTEIPRQLAGLIFVAMTKKKSLMKVINYKKHSIMPESWIKTLYQLVIKRKLSRKNQNYGMPFPLQWRKCWVPKKIHPLVCRQEQHWKEEYFSVYLIFSLSLCHDPQ